MPVKPVSQRLEWTGERYVPWLEDATIGYEHLHRYAFASQFVQNKNVLDLACGEGYGSRLLARTAKSVVGIDIDEDTIKHARNKYLKDNLKFELGSLTDAPLGQHVFDVITCFEAIEHIDDHDRLLREVKRLLAPDGVFIVSTPNKWAYSDQPQYTNPFHVHELYLDDFKALLNGYFRQVKFLGQRIYCNSNMWPIFPDDKAHLSEFVVERTPHEFNFVETDKRIPLYFISVASDTTEDIGERVSILVDSSNELFRQKDLALHQVVAECEHLKGQASSLISERDRLAAEREQFAREADRLRGIIQLQGEELLAIKDTIGWRALSKYRAVRERFGIIKFLHASLTEPVKRIYKKKNNEPNDAITLTAARLSLIGAGSAERVPNQLPCEMLVSGPGITGVSGVHNASSQPVRRKSMSGRPGTVLVLGDWLPTSDRASGGLRAFSILQILLGGGHNVIFGTDHEKSEHIYFLGSEAEVNQYQAILEELGIQVLYGCNEITRYLSDQGCDCSYVVLSFPEVAYRYIASVRAYAINAKVIYDPVDLHWLRTQRESAIKHDDLLSQKSGGYRRIERFNAAAADIVFAITDKEKALILDDVPNASVEVIPNIHACVEKVQPVADRKNLLFIGHYAHTPNEDAVSYFVQEIFPLIRRQIPGVIFYMVGSHMTETVKSLASHAVVAIGYVPDLLPYFNSSRVFVAPLRYGAGLKGKIGQSMSFGLPVVTTSIGAEGMHFTNGEHALIADSPAEFASAVVRLYTDDLLWEQMSTGSLQHIKTHYSKEVVGKKLEQVFTIQSDAVSAPPVVEVE
jgi:2-polyprenyl-3-methyl-5-hydroxy-6-metoxy-1,4-benzoquinol methylase/glycosyltransferase involved in cell wall biosynthesis